MGKKSRQRHIPGITRGVTTHRHSNDVAASFLGITIFRRLRNNINGVLACLICALPQPSIALDASNTNNCNIGNQTTDASKALSALASGDFNAFFAAANSHISSSKDPRRFVAEASARYAKGFDECNLLFSQEVSSLYRTSLAMLTGPDGKAIFVKFAEIRRPASDWIIGHYIISQDLSDMLQEWK